MHSLWDWISGLHSEGVDRTKTKDTRDLTKDIASIRSKPSRPTQAAGRFTPRRPVQANAPVIRQLEVDTEAENHQSTSVEPGDDLYWQGEDEGPAEEETLTNPDEEVLHITKAEIKAIFRRMRPAPPTFDCVQCKNGTHKLEDCSFFKALIPSKRNAYIRDQGICFHCLDGKHRIKECTYKEGVKCSKEGCDRYHHPLLHSIATMHLVSHAQFPEEELFEDLSASCYRTGKGCSSMQTLTVLLEGGKNQTQNIIAMLDSGANVSCIDEEFAKKIGAEELKAPSSQRINYLDRQISIVSRIVRVNITSLSGLETTSIDAWTVKGLTKGLQATNWSEEQNRWPHLRDLTFPPLPEDPRIYLLIGNNYPGCFLPERVVKGESFHDPLGYLTPFGWTVLGGTRKKYELLETNTNEELKTSHRFSFFTKLRSFFD